MAEFIITKLERDDQGHWHARVTPSGGQTIKVTRRYGSWLSDTSPMKELAALGLKEAPAALQQRVRRRELAEDELFEKRRQAAVASGRCAARERGVASRPTSHARIALQTAPGRVRARVVDRSRPS